MVGFLMMCGNQYSQLPAIFAPLDFIARLAGAGNEARRGLAALKSFVRAIGIKVGKIDIGVDLEPEAGSADSGDLEVESDPIAIGLKYKHDATQAPRADKAADQQFCSNCQFIQGAGDWAPCSIFPGKAVNAKGWCTAWVPKALNAG